MKNLTHLVVICLSALAGGGGMVAARWWLARGRKAPPFRPSREVDYALLTVEELSMRFRCGDIYLPERSGSSDRESLDPRALAFDELLRRGELRAGLTRAQALVFLGDPFNVAPGGLAPFEALDRFEYDYLDGYVVLRFDAERLRRIERIRGGSCGRRPESLLLC